MDSKQLFVSLKEIVYSSGNIGKNFKVKVAVGDQSYAKNILLQHGQAREFNAEIVSKTVYNKEFIKDNTAVTLPFTITLIEKDWILDDRGKVEGNLTYNFKNKTPKKLVCRMEIKEKDIYKQETSAQFLFTFEIKLSPYQLILTKKEVANVLIYQLRSKLTLDCTIQLSDRNYHCLPQTKIAQIMKRSKISKLSYTREKHDCDDFALLLKSAFIKDVYRRKTKTYPYCLGFLWGENLVEGDHAINIAITENKEVVFIEPQREEIFVPRSKDKGIYFICI